MNRRRLLAAVTVAAALALSGQQVAVAAGALPTTMTISVDSTKITAIVGWQGIVTPTGTVGFTVDGHSVGSKPLPTTAVGIDKTYTVKLSYHVPAGATRKVTATYSGDSLYAASAQTIVRRDPSITKTIKSAKPKTKYGWYRRPVTVVFHCVAHGSPIECPTPLRFDTNGKGQSGTASVFAANGGAATVKVKHINVDMQKPTLTVTGTGSHAVCHAKDKISGVASCRIRRVNGHYQAVAKDKAGNRRVVSVRS